jgi:protein associated with RNAse G/E
MYSLKGKWVEVQGYKHDGKMHRIWDSVYVLIENEDYLVACSKKTKVIEHDYRVRYTKEPAVMIFFKKRWYNVMAMIKEHGVVFYVNLASPYVVDDEKIKYIDYDLDIKLFPNDDIKLIDVREYCFHRAKYHYGEDIDKVLKYNVKEIKSMMESKKFPFEDARIVELYGLFEKETEK